LFSFFCFCCRFYLAQVKPISGKSVTKKRNFCHFALPAFFSVSPSLKLRLSVLQVFLYLFLFLSLFA
jgi:hypothetical protein